MGKQGSKKNSNNTSNSGQASTVGGSSLQVNKKNLGNNEKSSALAKSIFSESSENDSESTPVMSKRKTKKPSPQSNKPGNKKGSQASSAANASQASSQSNSSSNKKGNNKNSKNASSTNLGQTIIKQEVTTFTSTKGSSDTANT